jgi:DNA-binding XRE family transcriptional regulator
VSTFPNSDNESAARPLVKGRYSPELHLAIGMLRIFNAKDNNFLSFLIKKFTTFDAKGFTLMQKNVDIFYQKVYNIYKKYAKKFT